MRKCSPAIPGLCLYVLGKSLMSRASFFGRLFHLGSSMQKHAAKVRVCESNDPASDGYYVFVSLICTVLVMICAILLAFGIEMLA